MTPSSIPSRRESLRSIVSGESHPSIGLQKTLPGFHANAPLGNRARTSCGLAFVKGSAHWGTPWKLVILLQTVQSQSLIVGDVDSPSTVLIKGESGTGKELFSNTIDQLSPRRKKPSGSRHRESRIECRSRASDSPLRDTSCPEIQCNISTPLQMGAFSRGSPSLGAGQGLAHPYTMQFPARSLSEACQSLNP